MDASLNWPLASTATTTNASEEAWLLGQPPLQSYLDYIDEIVIGGKKLLKSDVVDEWRAANDIWYELERSEAGIADTVRSWALDKTLEPCVDEVRHSSRFRRGFDELPTRFAMVELEKLVVSQRHVDIQHTARLQRKLAVNPTPEELFWFCMPARDRELPVDMRRLSSKRFMFWSKSSDFRFQEAELLTSQQLQGYQAMGPVGAALGVLLGNGSNLLNVIESDKRLLLHNGHHRAYALLEKGIRFAPCIIRTVTRRDELDLMMSSNSPSDSNHSFYFAAARPPMLKDFFDARLRKVVRVPQLIRMLEVTIDVKEHELRSFES